MMNEREAFEQWMHDVMMYPQDELIFQDSRNCYADYATNLAWNAWQKTHLAQQLPRCTSQAMQRAIDAPAGQGVMVDGINPEALYKQLKPHSERARVPDVAAIMTHLPDNRAATCVELIRAMSLAADAPSQPEESK